MSESTEARELRLDKVGSPALLVGVIALIACVIGFFTSREQVLQSYLFGWVFWIGMSIGALALTLLHHTVRGSWGTALLRMAEAGGSGVNFLVFGLLFIPIALGAHDLYHWTHAEAVASDPILQHKAPYLNMTAWVIRAVVFFAMWAWLAWGLRQSSLRDERLGEGKETARRTNWSAPAIVFLILTLTFAVTDWVMSVDPHWFSTILPVWFLVSQGLAVIALGTFVVCRYAKFAPFKDVMSPSLTRDLGNMMLALTMFWSYVAVSQYLIIWSGNLPEFTTYYVARGNGGWEWIGNFLIVGAFFAPFIYLLAPTNKARPEKLARVALWIFVVRIVDTYWNVLPVFSNRATPMVTIWDVLAFVGLGGVWLFVFAKQVRQAPLLPSYDQRLKEMAHDAH